MNNKRRLAINMIAQILSFVINIGINFWITPYVTVHVGKEIYGFVNLAFQFTGYVTIITTALNSMLGRYVTIKLSQKDYKSASQYFTSVTFANVVLSLVMIIPTVVFIFFMEKVIHVPVGHILDVKILWAFILGSFLFNLMFEAYGVAFFATNRLDLGARRGIENNILKAVLLIGSYTIFIPQIWYIGAVSFISGIFLTVVNIKYATKLIPELQIKPQYFRWHAVKEVVLSGFWNSINLLSQSLISGLDIIITNLFIGAAEMTIMGFAKSMPMYISGFVGMISGTFSPPLMRTYAEGDEKKFLQELTTAMRICGFICSVPVIGFAVFGYDFYHLWLYMLSGSEIHTIQILSIMVLAQLILEVYIYPLYCVNTIKVKLMIPVFVSLGIGVGNVVGTLMLLRFTSLGIYSIQIVSGTLMVLKVVLFTPIYSAHILELKWYTFYRTLLMGAISSGAMILIFSGVRILLPIHNWFVFGVVCLFMGMIGYFINFWIVLRKRERTYVLLKISSMVGKK